MTLPRSLNTPYLIVLNDIINLWINQKKKATEEILLFMISLEVVRKHSPNSLINLKFLSQSIYK